MTTRPLGAQISHMLHSRGVDTIFGIPGVHNVEMYRGIEEAGIRHILARHEQGAGFMADGYARATGRPGICYVITGPGLLNALTALGQAQSDSVPVLAISSCLPASDLGLLRGRLHDMIDQAGAARAVCGWSLAATTPGTAYELIDRALAEFAGGRAGARHLQVPIDALAATAPPARAKPARPAIPHAPPSAIAAALGMIRAARRPMFIFGGGARDGWSAARALCAKLRAASFTTSAGRGITSPDDPLAFGGYLARPQAARVIGQADLVIAAGTELAEVDIWRADLGHRAPMIRVDIDPREMTDDMPADLPVLGDATAFLAALDAALTPQDSLWRAADVAAHRARWRAEADAERPGVLAVADAVKAALPPDCTVYSDMTQFAYVALETWDMAAPGLWHHPYGFGTLGYALPAAIGGKVGLGGRPVVAILGDYGLQYTLPELGTAVELGLSLPIIVWDNGKLKEIEESMRRSQIAPNAVIARNPDFLALARAYGAAAEEPANLADLPGVLTRALAAGRPTLIRLTPAIAG